MRDAGCFPEAHSCNLLLISLYTTGFSVPCTALRLFKWVCRSYEFDFAAQVLLRVKRWGWDNSIFFATRFGTYLEMAFSNPAHWVFPLGPRGVGKGLGDMCKATKRDVKDFCYFDSAVSCSPQCWDATPQLGPLTHAAIQLTAQFELCGLLLLTHSKDVFKVFLFVFLVKRSCISCFGMFAINFIFIIVLLTFITEFIKN